MKVLLVTDGSCAHETQLGSWGAVVVTPTKTQRFYGMAYPTTISRCELLPIIEGLKWIYYDLCDKQQGVQVKLVSDSEYTIQTINGLYMPKKNLDLWAACKALQAKLKVEACWRQRNSHTYMNLCDSVAHAVRTVTMENLYEGLKDFKIPMLPMEEI